MGPKPAPLNGVVFPRYAILSRAGFVQAIPDLLNKSKLLLYWHLAYLV